MKTKIEVFNEKKQFVERLNEVVTVASNITKLTYTVDFVNDDEVVRIQDGSATPYYVNVTGNSLQAILKEVSAFVLNRKPMGLVESRAGREYCASLFTEASKW